MITTANVTTSVSNIYASSGNTVMSVAYFCNYSTNPVQIRIYAVPDGSSDSNLNMIGSNVTIQGGDTYIMETEKIVFGNNDSLRANASVNNAISAVLSYVSV